MPEQSSLTDAKADCERLLDACISAADHFLRTYGEFYPFGRTMAAPGAALDAAAAYDGREHPPSDDVMHLLKAAFVQGAKNGDYFATALAWDVLWTPPGDSKRTDALAVALDHASGYSIVVYIPYSRTPDHVNWGQVHAFQGANAVFV